MASVSSSPNRRSILVRAAAAGATSVFFSHLAASETPTGQPSKQEDASMSTVADTAIRPFNFSAEDEALVDLRQRIAATKWPDRETVSDATQGVQLATIRELARYWVDGLRLAQSGGPAQRLAPVHHRDRRLGYSLHPRPFAT